MAPERENRHDEQERPGTKLPLLCDSLLEQLQKMPKGECWCLEVEQAEPGWARGTGDDWQESVIVIVPLSVCICYNLRTWPRRELPHKYNLKYN